jgi:hypothetical protein
LRVFDRLTEKHQCVIFHDRREQKEQEENLKPWPQLLGVRKQAGYLSAFLARMGVQQEAVRAPA